MDCLEFWNEDSMENWPNLTESSTYFCDINAIIVARPLVSDRLVRDGSCSSEDLQAVPSLDYDGISPYHHKRQHSLLQ